MSASPAPDVDDVLRPFLSAGDESSAQELLGELITRHAEPIIKSVVKSRMQIASGGVAYGRDRQEADDVCSDAVVQLIKRLRDLRSRASDEPVADFGAYVAVVSYHACDRYLRQKYPARHILRTKVRYLLTHHPGFMMWAGENRLWYCGRARPRSGAEGRVTADRITADRITAKSLRDLCENPNELRAAGLDTANMARLELARLVEAIFKWAGGPVEFDDLVKALWTLTGTGSRAGQPESLEGIRDALDDQLADTRVDISGDFDRRTTFARLWQEVCALPPRQRAVLLLNLRDGDDRSVTSLLPLTGICSFRQIADAVSMDAEELAKIWTDLPLADAVVADRLGIKRQQVINLRKSARERLARRMRGFL
jgi:DNA-directed RNA polymerase specialized sigma24 family protein